MIIELDPIPEIARRMNSEMHAERGRGRVVWVIMRFGSLADRVRASLLTGIYEADEQLKVNPAIAVTLASCRWSRGEMLLSSGLFRQTLASPRKTIGNILDSLREIILARIRESRKMACRFKAGRHGPGQSMSLRQVPGLLFRVVRAIGRSAFVKFSPEPLQ